MFAAIGAVAVVVIVLLAVFAGALRLPAPTAGTSVQEGIPLPYSEVSGPAESEQATLPGAPWTPDGVLGFGLATSYRGAGGLISGCTALWQNGSTIEVPATPSDATAGTVAFWAMASSNASGDVLLTYVTDLAGALLASNSVVVTGGCTASFTELGAIPTPVVDSTVVASATNTGGGSGFLASYPQATELFALLGPYWEVQYTTCSPFASGGTGANYVALFWATNGTLFETLGSGTAACSD